jgi:hypothetical protein
MNKIIIFFILFFFIIVICAGLYYFFSTNNSIVNNSSISNISSISNNSFSPLNIKGCSLWLDANDRNTIQLNNNNVTSWNDKSFNKFIFNQTNTSNQPQYETTTTTIKFIASNKNFLGGPTNFEIGTNSFSLFIVSKFNDTTSNGAIFNKSLYGDATGRILVVREGDNFNMLVTDKIQKNNLFKDTYPANKYRILSLIFNRIAGSSNIYENGKLINSYTYTNPDNSNLTNSYNMIIGGYNNSSGNISPPQDGLYFDGNIAEIIAYNITNDMKTSDQIQIENYLKLKWNI